jgi:hypothetical protein
LDFRKLNSALAKPLRPLDGGGSPENSFGRERRSFVSKFHPGEHGADLHTGEFFELIFRERANFECNKPQTIMMTFMTIPFG